MADPTIYASAVLVGAHAVLIQGPSGSGKSRLALALIQTAERGALPFTRLVADDRAHIEAVHGRLLVRPAEALVGLIEVRGLGIRRVLYEHLAQVGFIVELGAEDAERLPARNQAIALVQGISLPKITVPPDIHPLSQVLAYLQLAAQPASLRHCARG